MTGHALAFWERAARQVFAGMAQIMLQPSALVGLAFVAGMLLNSVTLTVFGLVGCAAGTGMAWLCRFPAGERDEGLYGFNGGLVGLSIGYFYAGQWELLGAVVPGAMASAALMHAMLRRGVKPFTFPFVAVTWFMMSVLWATQWAAPTAWSDASADAVDPIAAVSRGYGQVLFQEHILTGLVFVIAVAVRDRVQAIFATAATVIGFAIGYLAGWPADAVNLGLYGYNAVLCGVLFAGPGRRDAARALTAVLLSIAIVRLFHLVDLPPLTLPFVLSSWVVLYLGAHVKSLNPMSVPE